MSANNVIVVGVDGSSESLQALDWATDRAQRSGCRIHVLCAYALPSFQPMALDAEYVSVDDDALKNTAKTVVNEAAQRVRERAPEVSVSTGIQPGDPADVLMHASQGVAMVVIGTRGGGGFTDRLLGTVSSSLPAHAACPVVVVPRYKEGTPFTPINRIVVGVDGGETSQKLVGLAVNEADLWGASVTVTQAVPIASTAGIMAWLPASVDRDSIIAEVRDHLGEIVAEATTDHPDTRVKYHALDGNAAALMSEFSSAVELLVVGTRGRGGFAGLLLGSTSQAVLSHAMCPVMVVPTRNLSESPAPAPWGRS